MPSPLTESYLASPECTAAPHRGRPAGHLRPRAGVTRVKVDATQQLLFRRSERAGEVSRSRVLQTGETPPDHL